MASIRNLVSARTGKSSYRAPVRVRGRAPQSANFPATVTTAPLKRPNVRTDS
jgi:hypothetical protein